jgi:quinol monooxygenase YgiN
MHCMRRIWRLAALTSIVLAAAVLTGIGAQQAQQNAPKPIAPLYVTTFVDLTPPNAESGTALVKQYVLDTRKDPGIVRADALAQANRVNHLLVIEVWSDEAAFNKHVTAAHTLDYRKKLQSMLGAPFDERLHFVLQ